MDSLFSYFIIITFIIAYFFIYRSFRVLDPVEESTKLENNVVSILMSIGALLIPVFILILSNSIYVRLRGESINSQNYDVSFNYYKYNGIAELISFSFTLVAFMYFIILYDRGKRKNRGNSLLISVCVILTLANTCTHYQASPTSDEPNPSGKQPYLIHF